MFGLPDASVRESKERVKTAIKNIGYEFQSRKIVVNLAPADVRKEGSIFDLPIAVGILISSGYIKKMDLENTVIIGELSLDGKLNKVKGVLPITIEAKRLGIKRIILPKENSKEAAIINGIEVIGIESLKQLIRYLNGMEKIIPEEMDINAIIQNKTEGYLDFADVRGQENAKRALEIAVARWTQLCFKSENHGSGKTMLSARVASILPDLTREEMLDITKIYSIMGMLPQDNPIITKRPYRAPHHTISSSALIGGGKIPQLGEVSLAHNGILFLDELTEFKTNTLEVLRQPMEEKYVTINRLNGTVTYPSNFMLIASMNPCKCGFYGSATKKCTCTKSEIQKYIGKISGPLLDRIDIQIEVSSIKYEELNSNNNLEKSEEIRKRVNNARKIQLERYKQYNIYSNSQLQPQLIKKYCELDMVSEKILQKAYDNLKLTARAYNKILKVARTIADLENEKNIQSKHIAEAIQYRSLDKKRI